MSSQTRNILLILVAIAIVAAIIVLQNPFQQSSSASAGQGNKYGLITAPGSSQSMSPPFMGHPAPNFVLPDMNGNPVRLDSFRGKIVLINFWATWCPYCVREMSDMGQAANIFKDDLVILAVNTGESKSKVKRFVDANGISYPILLDTESVVAQAYLVAGMPTSYYVDKEGIIRQIVVGYHNLSEMERIIKSIS